MIDFFIFRNDIGRNGAKQFEFVCLKPLPGLAASKSEKLVCSNGFGETWPGRRYPYEAGGPFLLCSCHHLCGCDSGFSLFPKSCTAALHFFSCWPCVIPTALPSSVVHKHMLNILLFMSGDGGEGDWRKEGCTQHNSIQKRAPKRVTKWKAMKPKRAAHYKIEIKNNKKLPKKIKINSKKCPFEVS